MVTRTLTGEIVLDEYDIAEELIKTSTKKADISPNLDTQGGYTLSVDKEYVKPIFGPGLYAIFKDDICLYVGATGIDIATRLNRFVKSMRGNLRDDEGHAFGTYYRGLHGDSFDGIKVIQYPYNEDLTALKRIENAMITMHNPFYNRKRVQ